MWILQSSLGTDGDSWTFRMAPGAIKTASDSAIDVVDLDSTNGTYINNQRIRSGTLASGDRLRIGRVEMTIARQDLS